MQNGYRPDNQVLLNRDQDQAINTLDARISGAGVMSESITPSAVFQVTDRLPIFSYLVSSNRIRWYRVIMRFFLQCHRELYRYQLTAQEVRDTVRATIDTEYTLDQCQNDLPAPKEWPNLTTIYNSSRP